MHVFGEFYLYFKSEIIITGMVDLDLSESWKCSIGQDFFSFFPESENDRLISVSIVEWRINVTQRIFFADKRVTLVIACVWEWNTLWSKFKIIYCVNLNKYFQIMKASLLWTKWGLGNVNWFFMTFDFPKVKHNEFAPVLFFAWVDFIKKYWHWQNFDERSCFGTKQISNGNWG